MVPRLLLQRWQEILTMVGKSGTKLPRLVEKAIGRRWSDAVGFLASALGKNNLCLKNFKLKAETKIFSLEAMQNYTKMLGILSQLCVLLMALTYCILLSTCTLCARLLSPILWDDQEDGAGSSFFFNCHRCHHCVLLATGESTRLKRRPYLFQSAREIKEANSSKYQTTFRSLKREILWRYCHKLSNN